MVNELVLISKEGLTSTLYAELADVPPELEWLANLTNAKTRRAYKVDVAEFIVYTDSLIITSYEQWLARMLLRGEKT